MKGKVLLVDDDFAVLAGLAGVLVSEGYEVIHAADGEEAIEKFRNEDLFDIVLLDLNMPRRGGWDTFEQITATDPIIPIIVITARPDQFVTAVAAGVDALMEKPLDLSMLLQTMEDLLHQSVQERLARKSGRNPSTSYCPAPTEIDGTVLGRVIRPLIDRPRRTEPVAFDERDQPLDRLFMAWTRCSEADRQLFLEGIKAGSSTTEQSGIAAPGRVAVRQAS